MASLRGKVFVVALLGFAGALFGGSIVGFRAWLAHRPHTSAVRAVAISPDGTLVATASDDHSVKLWDSEGLGREPAVRASGSLFGHKKEVRAVAFLADGKRVVSGGEDSRVIFWDVATRGATSVREWSGPVGALAPVDDQRAAVGSRGRTEVVGPLTDENVAWDTAVRGGPLAYCTVAAISSDAALVAFGQDQGTVECARIGMQENGGYLRAWQAHPGPVSGLAFSQKQPWLISSGWDESSQIGSAKLWDLEGHLLRAITGPKIHVVGVGFSHDGSAVTVTHDGVLQVWQLPEGRETARVVLSPEAGHPTCLAVSPDGRWVAVGCERASNPAAGVLESGTVLRIDLP